MKCVVDDSIRAGFVTGALADLVKRLKRLELQISAKEGDFQLFGLFQRENSHGLWDIVVAAPWFSRLKGDPVRFIVERLQPALRRGGLIMMISRVVDVAPGSPFLQEVNQIVRVHHGLSEVRDTDFGGVEVSRGYVITSLSDVSLRTSVR